MNDRALGMIEATLKPMVEIQKRDINKMVMYVTPTSPLVEQGIVETKYGSLLVAENNWLQKGCSYIMEEISKGSTFGWVSRNERSS
ncbi:hypothetical protein GC096_03770 [Paenibacillus sp. LMG 31461]|uniref:Uncharacterized protein n=1 Tax=Paenibacillus plantarum TaxID=2654975 RepID=A0ABX1X439_9BACL|nr:hypothetical protein [Paenibacillus plantarum]NOU63164.1 hypothetical protein [Paenibacillus plantarum]